MIPSLNNSRPGRKTVGSLATDGFYQISLSHSGSDTNLDRLGRFRPFCFFRPWKATPLQLAGSGSDRGVLGEPFRLRRGLRRRQSSGNHWEGGRAFWFGAHFGSGIQNLYLAGGVRVGHYLVRSHLASLDGDPSDRFADVPCLGSAWWPLDPHALITYSNRPE